MLNHEQLGDGAEAAHNSFEPEIVGMPVGAYLDWAIEEHAAPDRHPGRLNLDELTAPIVAIVVVGFNESVEGALDSDNHATLLRLLEMYYAPAAYDDPRSGRQMTERSASRAIVSHTVRALHLWSLENDLPELSQQVVATACTLAEKEMEGGDSINWWLTDTLQGVVAAQEVTEDPRDSPTWIRAADHARVHDVLVHAINVNERLGLEFSTIAFMLEHHGLQPETFLDAWQIGFKPECMEEKVIANLLRVVKIEALQPGICQRLLVNNGIRCLTRYPTKLLLYLDDFHEPRDRTYECASIHTAIHDPLGAFNREGRYKTLFNQVVAAGRNFEVYEWGSVEERNILEERARERNPRTVHKLEQAHSDGWNVVYGDLRRGLGNHVYSGDDMERDQDRVRALHEGIAQVALNGCGIGRPGGMAQALSKIIDARVVGLSRTSGSSIRYSKLEGFKLTAKDGTPAGLFSSSRSRVARLLFPPRVNSYHAWSDRQLAEGALAMSQLAS